MKVLIFGFEPFNEFKENPSESLVRRLLSSSLKKELPFKLLGFVLPVSFKKAFDVLKPQLHFHRPDYVIGFGLAPSRDEMTPERIAINLMDSKFSDNDGFQPDEKKIIEGGADGLFSNLPLKAMVAACQEKGVPSSISNTARTYVCNDLMYKILHYSYGGCCLYKGGFIHIPPTSKMALEKMLLGAVAMLNVLVQK